MSTVPENLAADRYGRRPRRARRMAGYVVIAVIAAVMALGWTASLMNYWSADGVIPEVQSYRADPATHVMTIAYDLHKPSDKAVTCRVEATDVEHRPVGSRYVRTPAGKSDVQVTSRFPYHGVPVTGQVKDCRTGG